MRAAWDEDDDDERMVARVVDAMPCRSRLLDLGVGPRRVADRVAGRRDAFVIGADATWAMVAGLTPTVIADRALPFPAGVFDGSWSVLTFQHLPDEVAVGYCAELDRVTAGPIVVQSSVGTERGVAEFRRPAGVVAGWFARLGRDVVVSTDPAESTWEWTTAD